MTAMLQTQDLTIRFGGHVAVDHVSCAFEPGTLTAIVGPNGAGKTTYFNLISGQLPASEGAVLLNGEDITALPAPLRTRRGLGRAFQLTQLFPNLTVQENVRLAVQAREQGARPRRARPVARVARPQGAGSTRRARSCEQVRLADKRDAHASQPAARRPAQARGGAADGAGPAGLHVRRTHRRHERGRGAGGARPDPRAEGAQGPTDPAGRAQDGRGARAVRPHHRAAQRRSWWPTASRPR